MATLVNDLEVRVDFEKERSELLKKLREGSPRASRTAGVRARLRVPPQAPSRNGKSPIIASTSTTSSRSTTHGHPMGDEVLKRVAKPSRTACATGTGVARMGRGVHGDRSCTALERAIFERAASASAWPTRCEPLRKVTISVEWRRPGRCPRRSARRLRSNPARGQRALCREAGGATAYVSRVNGRVRSPNERGSVRSPWSGIRSRTRRHPEFRTRESRLRPDLGGCRTARGGAGGAAILGVPWAGSQAWRDTCSTIRDMRSDGPRPGVARPSASRREAARGAMRNDITPPPSDGGDERCENISIEQRCLDLLSGEPPVPPVEAILAGTLRPRDVGSRGASRCRGRTRHLSSSATPAGHTCHAKVCGCHLESVPSELKRDRAEAGGARS